jgi:branched-chain amino acid transport system substrate-binding protein
VFVPIALLTALTGGYAQSGMEAVRGAQLAVALVNEARPDLPLPLAATAGLPGLGGAVLRLITADTGGAPEGASTQAEDLVTSSQAVAAVVADSPEVAASVARQGQRLRIPVADAFSTADYLTEQGLSWYFRIGPTDRLLAETAFALLARQLSPPRRLALVVETGGHLAAEQALVADLANRLGYAIVATIEAAPGNTNADVIADQLNIGQPGAVVALVDTARADALVDVVTGRFPALPVIGLGRGVASITPSSRPQVLLRTTAWSADLAGATPAGGAVMQWYADRFGSPMTAAAASAFTATLLLAQAIDAAGTRDPASIRAALRQVWLSALQTIMPWNGIRFADNGQNPLAAGIVEGWTGTTFQVMYPRELSTSPMIWAYPHWAAR